MKIGLALRLFVSKNENRLMDTIEEKMKRKILTILLFFCFAVWALLFLLLLAEKPALLAIVQQRQALTDWALTA